MTVLSQTPYTIAVGNGVSTVYPFTFKLLKESDLVVTVDGVAIPDTAYSVSGLGDNAGGDVTFVAAPAISADVFLERVITFERLVDYQYAGDLKAEVLNPDVDRIWMAVQQIQSLFDRSIHFPAIESGIDSELPALSARLNNLLGFDENGEIVAVAPAAQSASALQALLAQSSGSSLVGFIQSGAGAYPITLQNESRFRPVTPQQFGAVGDGTTDDYAALTAMFATGKPWYIPYTAGGYKTTGRLTVNADGICDGFIVPTTAIGVNPVVVIADSGYGIKRRVIGLAIHGSVSLRAAGVMGIRVDCANAHLINCSGYQLNYGCIVRMYSVTLTKCSFWQNNTNLSAYARNFTLEVNALTLDGGNYDSAVYCGINIGDTSWPDALAAGNSHGVNINIIGAINTDGSESRIDNCGSVNIIGNYAETTNTDCLWRLGGGGDGYLLNVTISGNFLKNAKYAVLCDSAVNGLHVGPNYLSGITISEVKMTSDLYGLDHRKGVYVGCFGNGQVVGIAFRSLALSAIDFIGWTLEVDRLYNGSYYSNVYPDKWYPTTVYKTTQTESMNRQSFSSKGVYYTTPSTGKAGTVSSNSFTFTTKSDSYAFNGGDKITTAPAGAAYIRSIDWDTGIALLDGGVTANGAATISQAAPYVSSVTYATAPPAGSWNQGDICWNFSATVGQPKGWLRTAGAWVSMGNL
jgi:hypothetical protein